MSEQPILITQLNDFIFCPVSIYYHSLDEDTDKYLYQDSFQINGTAAHNRTDLAEYSKNFDENDSVYIFYLSKNCKIQKYGYAKHEDTDLIII